MKTPLAGFALLGLLAAAPAAPVPKEAAKTAGILVLDDSDRVFKGKAAYEDNLQFFGTDGKERFHLSGFNNAQTYSGTRMIATDPTRKSIWVLENVAHRVRRFDLAGKELAVIEGVKGTALAVDPETGNVWAATNSRFGGGGEIRVYSPKGEKVATHDVAAWDLMYDPKVKAFWAAEKSLTKLAAKDGKVLVQKKLPDWCASSVAVNPTTGDVWVGIRDVPGDKAHQLLRFDTDGEAKATVALADCCPWRVAVDPKSGSAWMATMSRGVREYTAAGKLAAEHDVADTIGVEIDPNGDGAWVLTRTDTRLLSFAGKELRKVAHKKPTDQAWIAAYKE